MDSLETTADFSPTNVEVDTRRVVDEFYKRINATPHNPEKIAELFSDKIDWYIPVSKYMPWSGQRSLRSELPALFSGLFASFESDGRLTVDAILVDGKQMAIFGIVARTVKVNHQNFTARFAQSFTVEDGLIVRMHMYEETIVIEKALSKPPKVTRKK